MKKFGFRHGKVLLVFALMAFSVSSLLFPAITLNTFDTRVLFEIEEPKGAAVSNQRVPVCELSLLAKQKAPGTVSIIHTPLSDGTTIISYSLTYEDDGTFKPLIKAMVRYTASSNTLESVPIAKLWAELAEPFKGNTGNFASDVAFNLILEQ
jgi:hypothetical protein